jgi:hypothetical protein
MENTDVQCNQAQPNGVEVAIAARAGCIFWPITAIVSIATIKGFCA